MQRVASGILSALGVAATVAWTACGGGAFTAGGRDAASSTGASSGSMGDGSTPRVDDGDATEASSGSSGSSGAGSSSGGDASMGEDVTGVVPPIEGGPIVGVDGTVPPLQKCPGGKGPTMVNVGSFCIDGTEVTNAQYNDFLSAKVSTDGQPSECAWNDSFVPGNGWTFTSALANRPIASVDWCDAFAYCKWAGKHLCGKIGGGAGDFAHYSSIDNEHYMACSNLATRIYPYGNTYVSSACNGKEAGQMQTVDVGSKKNCEGGVPGLFDMAGNVEEWQNACDGTTGNGDHCLNGDGAYDFGDPPNGSRCDYADNDLRDGQYPDVGIRCCASLN